MKLQQTRLNHSALCNLHSTLEWRSRWDLHPQSSRRQRVAFLFSYGSGELASPAGLPSAFISLGPRGLGISATGTDSELVASMGFLPARMATRMGFAPMISCVRGRCVYLATPPGLWIGRHEGVAPLRIAPLASKASASASRHMPENWCSRGVVATPPRPGKSLPVCCGFERVNGG